MPAVTTIVFINRHVIKPTSRALAGPQSTSRLFYSREQQSTIVKRSLDGQSQGREKIASARCGADRPVRAGPPGPAAEVPHAQRDQAVPRGPGGPPHKESKVVVCMLPYGADL